MYEATGERAYRDHVITCLNRLEAFRDPAEGLPAEDYLAYFFALNQTGDEKYRQRIESLIAESGWTLESLPFVTAYETEYKRKEHYNEIAAFFREKDEFTGKELVALIETIDQMSEEIYEYYRELKDLFKAAVREKAGGMPAPSETAEIGYAILKACNTGVLQPEKYRESGERFWMAAPENPGDSWEGLQEMYKAQRIILKKQEA